MSELTDLEICKRIAEIEGLMFCVGNRYKRIEIWKDGKVFKYEKFNPLKDNALCFRLMIKHRVCCEPFLLDESWACRVSSFSNSQGKGYVIYNDLNRAICLAIIESKARCNG